MKLCCLILYHIIINRKCVANLNDDIFFFYILTFSESFGVNRLNFALIMAIFFVLSRHILWYFWSINHKQKRKCVRPNCQFELWNNDILAPQKMCDVFGTKGLNEIRLSIMYMSKTDVKIDTKQSNNQPLSINQSVRVVHQLINQSINQLN